MCDYHVLQAEDNSCTAIISKLHTYSYRKGGNFSKYILILISKKLNKIKHHLLHSPCPHGKVPVL